MYLQTAAPVRRGGSSQMVPPRCANPMSLAAPSRQLRPSASPHREHWRQLSGLSRQDAMVQYLLLAQKLVGNLQACPCRLAF